jgi:hypothetical protein
METEQNVGGRDRLARALLAALLSVLALRWLKRGKKGRGLLAGVGALGFGFNATTGYCGANDALDIDTTTGDAAGADIEFDSDESDDGRGTESVTENDHGTSTESAAENDEDGLTCADCGEPIVPGQLRGPNEQGRTVHENCA